MFRFLFRVLAVVSLAIAVIMAVIDVTRSIAADALVMTPLGESWLALSPDTLAASEEFTRDAMLPELWDLLAVTVLVAPGFAVFVVLALLFYVIGRRPERRRRFVTT